MASLCTGNYGMSQNCMDEDEGKEYFFVKLTDSAFRAIEEYQKNQSKCGSHATIQIIGNGGVLSFPNGNVGQKFSFSVDDVDGSIECIEQNQNQLDVLGTLPYKMRIHANDDVYETTRYRMAVAEETQKNKCTREIKPNQTDIGRKVKVKTPVAPNHNNNNSSARPLNNILPKRDHSSSRSPSTIGNNSISPSPVLGLSSTSLSSSSLSAKSSSNNLYCSPNTNMPTTASSLSSALSSAAGSGTSGINNGYFSSSKEPIMMGNGNNEKASSVITSSGNRMQKVDNRHKPDITKRKIRERLIHLLALKPFKKPELYSRLQTEGIRDREKNLISTILKEISIMRDNTYNLKRPMWNDVNEDWPFYSEQETQMLKRRKPQNLTPLSSDGGSSTSGQSPTSTHNGSPTPAVKRPTHDRDRDHYYDDPMAKKQRISHFKKDNHGAISANSLSSKNHQESDDNSIDLSYAVLDNDFMPNHGAHQNKLLKNCNNNNKSPYANNNDKQLMQQHQQSPSINYNHHNPNNDMDTNSNSGGGGGGAANTAADEYHPQPRQQTVSPIIIKSGMKNGIINNSPNKRDKAQSMNFINQTTDNNSSSKSKSSIVGVGGVGAMAGMGGPPTERSNVKYDFSKFSKITSIEQRRLYKTEFEKNFDEYRILLTKIENVGSRFKMLADRLNSTRNDDDDYRNIKRQIVSEYKRITGEEEHRRAKTRFDYLHAKLAHIKNLVSEYDKTLTSDAENVGAASKDNQHQHQHVANGGNY